MSEISKKEPKGLALLPLLVFIGIYLGAGIVLDIQGMDMAFYQFPSPVAILIGKEWIWRFINFHRQLQF